MENIQFIQITAVQLLEQEAYAPEEDVHRQQDSHACQILTHLVCIVLYRQLPEHIIRQLIDDALPWLAAASAALLGLHTQYRVQDACKQYNNNSYQGLAGVDNLSPRRTVGESPI